MLTEIRGKKSVILKINIVLCQEIRILEFENIQK